MSKKLDYEAKYKSLRENFLSATDRAYSVGYEHGMRDAAQQQMQQQQEQQMQMMQMQAQAQQGQPGEAPPESMPSEPQDMGQMADETDAAQLEQQETEFESALNELEQILGAGPEVDKAEAAKVVSQLTKSLSAIKQIKGRIELRKSMAIQPLNKSERLKAAHKVFKQESKAFNVNLEANRKQAISMQKAMVNSIVDKMRQEEDSVVDQILKNLKTQGQVK